MYRNAVSTFDIGSDEAIREVSKLYFTEPRRFALMSMIHSQGLEYQIEESTVNVTGKPVGVKIVDNPDFEQQLDEIDDVKTSVDNGGGYASGDTSIVVEEGGLVPDYALLYVSRTGEIMRVSSVSTNTLTVTRGVSGTTAAALNDNDELMVLGSAYGENKTSGEITSSNTSFTTNYTQIDREPFGNSRTEQGTKKYGIDNSYEHRKKKALIRFLRRWNGRMWLGQKSKDTTNEYRTMGGILEGIDSGNVYDVNGDLSRAEFEYWMRKYALAYNGSKKTLFCGSRLIERINSWATDKNITQKEDNILQKFGLAVRTYFTPWGELDLVYEPYFDETQQGDIPLNSYGVALDLNMINVVYFNNGVLQSKDDIQENDRDGRKGEWLMEGSAQVNVPKAHAILRNI